MILAVLAGWLVLSVVLAPILGKAIKLRDERH